MKLTKFIVILLLLNAHFAFAQTNPAITKWLQNTTIKGRHYVSGNSTPIQDDVLANVQKVQYSTNWAYITTQGIPTYVTGPFQDGNPSIASAQNAIYRISLNPTKNTGTFSNTTGGNIGIFINGVSLFDYRDGVAWNPTTNALCGGPGNPVCPGGPMTNQDWNRDAIPAERKGFDCAKAHPAMGNYHHHQNPSAFKLDRVVVSTICSLYDADGLYVIDTTKHSPLIGYAYDGFPIYGAYAYKNVNGTGGIARIKSSYSLRNITTRMTSPAGTVVSSGPNVSTTYPLGYFREDYQYTATSAATPDFLDEHNGRFCVTPEYPNGIYCYFSTVDANWNSAYPYVVGPTFYGVVNGAKVASVMESVSTYTTTATADVSDKNLEVTIFPNPTNEFLAIQAPNAESFDRKVELISLDGKVLQTKTLYQGSSICYFDIRTVYAGVYLVKVSAGQSSKTMKVVVSN